MVMLAGTATVTAGVISGTGLSQELCAALASTLGIPQTPINSGALSELAKVSNTIASTVIAHITTNAVVSTTDTGTVAAGIAVTTAGTATAQSGATVATGAVTATGTGTVA